MIELAFECEYCGEDTELPEMEQKQIINGLCIDCIRDGVEKGQVFETDHKRYKEMIRIYFKFSRFQALETRRREAYYYAPGFNI